eukprot:275996_1
MTAKTPNKIKNLVIGYLRSPQKGHNIVLPNEIHKICMDFYYIPMSAAKKRLMKDLCAVEKEQGICAAPMDDNYLEWEAVIFGADDTEWEGGTFKLRLSFTEEYPHKGPRVNSQRRCFIQISIQMAQPIWILFANGLLFIM